MMQQTQEGKIAYAIASDLEAHPALQQTWRKYPEANQLIVLQMWVEIIRQELGIESDAISQIDADMANSIRENLEYPTYYTGHPIDTTEDRIVSAIEQSILGNNNFHYLWRYVIPSEEVEQILERWREIIRQNR